MSQSEHSSAGKSVACRHFLRGVCIHPKNGPPDDGNTPICSHITDLMRDWDAFLDRVEAFGLSDAKAEELWRKRAGKKMEQGDWECCVPFDRKRKKSSPAKDFMECAFLAEGLCLRMQPACPGGCSLFEARGEAQKTL